MGVPRGKSMIPSSNERRDMALHLAKKLVVTVFKTNEMRIGE